MRIAISIQIDSAFPKKHWAVSEADKTNLPERNEAIADFLYQLANTYLDDAEAAATPPATSSNAQPDPQSATAPAADPPPTPET